MFSSNISVVLMTPFAFVPHFGRVRWVLPVPPRGCWSFCACPQVTLGSRRYSHSADLPEIRPRPWQVLNLPRWFCPAIASSMNQWIQQLYRAVADWGSRSVGSAVEYCSPVLAQSPWKKFEGLHAHRVGCDWLLFHISVVSLPLRYTCFLTQHSTISH
jgi:hypothetical protein